MIEIARLDESRDLADIEQLEQASMPQPWSRKLLQDELRSARAFNFGFWLDGRLVAQLFAQRVLTELSILNISVTPDNRRQGHARKLLSEVLRQAQDVGVEIVFLEVRESNRAAIALYEGAGFRQTGVRNGYYSDTGENALLFACRISEQK